MNHGTADRKALKFISWCSVVASKLKDYKNRIHTLRSRVNKAKKNIKESYSFDVMQTVFIAFTCKFGLVL